MRRLLPLALAVLALSPAVAGATFEHCVGDRCVYHRGGATVCFYDNDPKGSSKVCVP